MEATPPLVGRGAELQAVVRACADPATVGVLLVGRPGVGRSRLAATAAGVLTERGIQVAVLDDAPALPPEAVASAIGPAGPRRFIVATAPAGERLPDVLVAGVRDGAWARLELSELGPGAVDELVAWATSAAVEERTAAHLAKFCGGLPAYLVAVVRDALEDGSLQVIDGLARWRPERFAPAVLGDLVEASLAGCDPDVRRLADLLAVTGDLPMAVLERLGAWPAAVRAETAGVVEGRRSGTRVVVGLAIPAVALALQAGAPLLARIDRLREALEAWEQVGPTEAEDRRRLALWSLETGREVDCDELVAAAVSAVESYEYAAAERLARAALAGGHPGAATVLADALEKQGRHEDVHTLLAFTADRGPSRIRLAANLYWGRGDLDGAEHALDDLGADLDADDDGELPAADAIESEAMRAWLLMAAGRQADATGIARRLRRATRPDDPGYTWATVIVALDASLAGHNARAVAMLRPLVSFTSPGAPFERSAAGLGCTFALLSGGSIGEAIALAAEGRRWAVEGGVDMIIGGWHGLSGMAARAGGDLPAACTHFHQALASLGDDPYRFSRLFVAEAAAAWAQRGDAARAREWWDQAGDRDAAGLNRLFEPWTGRLGAWVAAAEGDLPGAIDRAMTAADEAAALGQHLAEMAALHTVARLGRPADVAARAADVAARVPRSPLVSLAAAIEAAATQDGWALADAAVVFAALGASGLAAETATAAAHAHQRRSQRAPLQLALELREHFLGRCSGLVTPGTAAPGRAVLTTREREVALLAARGITSVEIAAKLGLSRRTVDNHLAHVYDKLGVHRRQDLAALLGRPRLTGLA